MVINRIRNVVIAAIFMLGMLALGNPLTVSADQQGDYTYTVDNGKATITGCNIGIGGDITVPDALGGYPVTSIGQAAFSKCTGITSITIPKSVTRIERYPFAGCTSLTSIIVDTNNVQYSSIDGVLFNKDVTTLVECPDGRTTVTIPTSVTSIGESAFLCCTRLTSITIPSSVTSIDPAAFLGCTGLTSITIPSSVTSIRPSTFSNCTSLTSITIPRSVTSIGRFAFDGCSSLTYIIGYSPSYAKDWAKNNGITFISLTLESVSLNDNVKCFIGSNRNLSAIIYPSTAENKNITWSSSDPTVVEVDQIGKITALKAGSAIITVTTQDGNKTANCNVTAIELDATGDVIETGPSPTDRKIESGKQGSANVSIPTSIGRIIESGKQGSTNVSIPSTAGRAIDSGKQSTPTVIVTGNNTVRLTKITITGPSQIKIGEVQPFVAQGTFSDLTTVEKTSDAVWSSSNDSIASVNSGMVTAKERGIITLKAVCGTKSYSITINIIK